LNQILKRQTSRFHYGSKVPAVTITVFKYRNKICKIVVKAVPYFIQTQILWNQESNRTQTVVLDGESSDIAPVTFGVP
jgi:hypothetical protein